MNNTECREKIKTLYEEHGIQVFQLKWLKDNGYLSKIYYRLKNLGCHINEELDHLGLREEYNALSHHARHQPKPRKPVNIKAMLSESRNCSHCGEVKNLGLFYPHYSFCKDCTVIKNKLRINTNLHAFLSVLLSSAKQRSQKRLSKGRGEAAVYSLTIEDLKDALISQDFKCYYSGITLKFQQHSDWQCSLERLNPQLGYTKDNIALIASEFQGASQWTTKKYANFIETLSIKQHSQIINWDDGRIRATQKRMQKIIKNGVEYWHCNVCHDEKLPDNFYHKHERHGCKDCIAAKQKAYHSTPRGHLAQLSHGMKTRSNIKTWESVLDVNDLIAIWEAQGGLCAYSRIPMTFGYHKEKNWIASAERRDSSKPYTRENTCLICYEFNTGDRTATAKDKSTVTGFSAWNREKINFIKDHISQNTILDIRYLFE